MFLVLRSFLGYFARGYMIWVLYLSSDQLMIPEIRVLVDLRVMAVNGSSAFLKPPKFEPHQQMQFSDIHNTF